MHRPKTSELVLILSEKCDCRHLAKPLRGLLANDCIMTYHRFDGNEQFLLLDLTIDDERKVRNRIRNFRVRNPNCKLFDKNDFDKLGKKGKSRAWLTSSASTQLIKLGLDIWSKLQILGGHNIPPPH